MENGDVLHRDTAREEYFYQQGRFEAIGEAFAHGVVGTTLLQQEAVVRNAKAQL